MTKKTIVMVAAIVGAMVMALGAVAVGASKTTQQPAPRDAGSYAGSCWNPGYVGGYSWSADGNSGCGWHTTHAQGEPCSAEHHTTGCGCQWCSSVGTDDLTQSVAAWQATPGCNCGWCANDSAAVDSWWHAHGTDCGCAWCAGHDSGLATTAGVDNHAAQCGCGWCYGHATMPADGSQATYSHGPGCCCGCGMGTHAVKDGSDAASPAKPARRSRGCGCGCC